MSCQETLDLIHGYVDGELDLLRSVDIEKHLAECKPCSREYGMQLALKQSFRTAALRFSAPAGLRGRVLSSLRPREEAADATRAFEGRPVWKWLGMAAAVALAVVTGWSLSRMAHGSSPDELQAQKVVSSHVRSLMANHLTDVPSTDQHTVKPWFNGKLDFSPRVKDLASEGFPLVGGRLDYLGGRPVAALVYQRGKHFINLFTWPSSKESGQKTFSRQGYYVIHWSSSGKAFWVVADLNLTELNEFAELVQK